jgi:hypothetical protein
VLGAIALGAACSSPTTSPPAHGSPDDLILAIEDAPSCVLDCGAEPPCGEATQPWKCPALGGWGDLPHDGACGDPAPPTPANGA